MQTARGRSDPLSIVGSFASMVHGEPRTTQDLDVVIDPSTATLERFLASIDMDAFYVDPDVTRDALRRRSTFNVIDMNSAWKVDFMIRRDRAFSSEELTATAEDTIIAKLEWAKAGSSERQLLDVTGIVRLRADAFDQSYLERWIDELGLRVEWEHALTMR